MRKTTDRFLTTYQKDLLLLLSASSHPRHSQCFRFRCLQNDNCAVFIRHKRLGCVSLTLLLARRAVIICVPLTCRSGRRLQPRYYPSCLFRVANREPTCDVVWHSEGDFFTFSGLPFLSCKVAVICCGAVWWRWYHLKAHWGSGQQYFDHDKIHLLIGLGTRAHRGRNPKSPFFKLVSVAVAIPSWLFTRFGSVSLLLN